jgi:putative ABC transport system permease protein
MNPGIIAWRMVRARGLHQSVSALVLALGLGLMLATVAVGDAAREAVSSVAARYPLVVGPRGGAVPLVLGALTRLQDLEASLPLSVYQQLAEEPGVEVAVPLLAGHAVRGHPLLGTSPAWLEPRERYPLSDGRIFALDAMEVVLGASAAEALAVGVGDTITIEHQHAGAPGEPGHLKVVGVLAPTHGDADETLFCPLHAIYQSHDAHEHDANEHEHEHEHDRNAAAEHDHDHDAHEHEHEHEHDAHEHAHEHAHDAPAVSAVLVRPADDHALLALQERLQEDSSLEIALTGQTLRRISDQLAGGGRLLRLIVGVVVLVTFLSLLTATYGSSLVQSREVAVLRVLGARRLQVLGIVATATLLVVAAGVAGSLVVASVLGGLAEEVLRYEMGLDATVHLLTGQVPAYLGIGSALLVLVGVQPALAAYHLQAAEALGAPAGSGLATRSYLRWGMRFLIPLAVFVAAEQMVAQHGSEGFSRPLDEASTAIFDAHRAWTTGDPPSELSSLVGQQVEIEGYMYALGDPWEVEDFYLVAINPRLPRCPFCYRAPTRHERILVRSPGGLHEVAPGLVKIEGRLLLEPDGRDQVVVELQGFEVVLER